jgi:hypothetical protein
MTNSQRLATVRARFLGWLADQDGTDRGAEGSPHRILRESILIRDEFFCGRRFYAASHHAVWFIEEDELKIFKKTGELVCVLTGDQLQLDSASDRAEQETESAPDVIKLPLPVARDDRSGETTSRAA